ncbi:GtrA family protein [Corynebacterium cystitidis]|uniref:GtrA family protein n=1 Tax=Corynebacterium cystitidis TaxID=35757 RepID=UPI00211F0354|nr:GtrA family protein [Corynebacterium cystitidis]
MPTMPPEPTPDEQAAMSSTSRDERATAEGPKGKRFDDNSAIVQLVRFTAVGILTALIDWSLTMLFTHVVGWDRQVAKAIGWVFGTLAAYLLNSKFTFKSAVSARKALAVFVLYASTFAIQQLMYWVTNAPLIAIGFEGGVKDTISFVIAQGVATITNFVLQRVLIFKKD